MPARPVTLQMYQTKIIDPDAEDTGAHVSRQGIDPVGPRVFSQLERFCGKEQISFLSAA
jgi:hypothetical protein